MTVKDEGKGFTVTDRRAVRGDGGDDQQATEPGQQHPAPEAGSAGEAPKALPQIDFATFVMSLASSVLIHLGEMQGPGQEERVNLPLAKQTVDILGMLEEKTRGNLTDEEARVLQHLLFDLRLKFVEARKRS